MYHSSHCIHVRCPVVDICRDTTSEQTREFLIACPYAQNLPLFAPPDTMKDEMFSRLDCLAAFTEIRFRCLDVVQVPIQWCHPCAELREDTRLSFAELVVHAPRVVARPRSVDSAHCFPECRRHLRSRLRQALLGF